MYDPVLTFIVRALLIVLVLVIAWAVARPLVVRWLRALLRDVREDGEDNRQSGA